MLKVDGKNFCLILTKWLNHTTVKDSGQSPEIKTTGRSYTQNFGKFTVLYTWLEIDENFQLPMKKCSMSLRLLTVKDTSGTNLRTSHTQLSGKGSQYRKEDSENKILY